MGNLATPTREPPAWLARLEGALSSHRADSLTRWFWVVPGVFAGITFAALGLGLAGLVAAFAGALSLTTLWAIRPALYHQLGYRELALEVTRAQIRVARDENLRSLSRLNAAAFLVELDRLPEAKEQLAQVDPEKILTSRMRAQYFLVQGGLFTRTHDVEGLRVMIDAAEADLEGLYGMDRVRKLLEQWRSAVDLWEGEYDRAIERLEAIPLEGEDELLQVIVWNNLAWAELCRQGDRRRALEFATRAHALRPDLDCVQGTYGCAMLENGAEPEEVLELLEMNLREDSPTRDHAYGLFCAARARAALGHLGEARDLRARLAAQPGGEPWLEQLEALPES